jgi:tRNA(adenine34) deaminase
MENTSKFSNSDKIIMRLALEEAKIALNKGDYPVGAVLVIDREVVAKKRNRLHNDKDWVSHAELLLITENSKLIREKIKSGSKVELFTTLEPCLMCLGASVSNRISRIVFSCPDPHGGSTHLNPKQLTDWYARKWPKIEGGLLHKESYGLMIQFMKSKNTETWNRILKLFEAMYK